MIEHKKYAPLSILKNIIMIGVTCWLILGAFPTGWIYDIGVGTGTKQGQIPNASVQRIQIQEEIEQYFFQDTPATVSKNDLMQCPLMRLRDAEYAGAHTNARKRTVMIPEYKIMSYPVRFVDHMMHLFVTSAWYNGYYLAPLEDGSYVCVYFDDSLLLRSGEQLHTGYVRYTTTEEKTMLHGMAQQYEVNPVYVLDMYRHGKVSWMLDFVIRIALVVLLWMVYLFVLRRIQKMMHHAPER